MSNDNNISSSSREYDCHDNIRPRLVRDDEYQNRPILSSVERSNNRCLKYQGCDMTKNKKQTRYGLTAFKTMSKISIVICLSLSLLFPDVQQMSGMLVLAGNYNGYYYNYYNNNNNYDNNNGNNGYFSDDKVANEANDDGSNNANDDGNNANDDGTAVVTDDVNANQQDDAAADASNDDLVQEESYAAAQGEDDYYAADDAAGDMGDDNAYLNEDESNQQSYQLADDDVFHWNENVGFSGVSILPLSCVNYNSGHMIKFQLYDSEKSKKCHFSEISTFVVSISHYMRAYFNYQALLRGQDFHLPDDAAYLNCIQLQETTSYGMALYAKVGCMQRETFTSTRLQLHVYTDAQCSQHYDDGESLRSHAVHGYKVGTKTIKTKVTFRPDFYTCMSCSPDQISYTFNKRNSNWYDDDYIGSHGNNKKSNGQTDDAASGNATDDAAADDQYFSNNDDYKNYQNDDGNRRLEAKGAPEKELTKYQNEFWAEYDEIIKSRKPVIEGSHRSLYENYYDIGDWNMCQRLYKYGVWCDEECRSLDFFRTNVWSASDVFLLGIMCLFMTAMLLLIIAKRLKAQQKARSYGDDHPVPGLPPCAMAIMFFVIMGVIVTLARVRFINETLVFAVVTCVLLFIYMLKLTLFESRRPILLAAPKHDIYDNPLDDRLFD